MNKYEQVEVFNYKAFDFRAGEHRQSKYKATREAVFRLKGEVLEGTSEWVPRGDLDENGRFRRVPLGWGRAKVSSIER